MTACQIGVHLKHDMYQKWWWLLSYPKFWPINIFICIFISSYFYSYF